MPSVRHSAAAGILCSSSHVVRVCAPSSVQSLPPVMNSGLRDSLSAACRDFQSSTVMPPGATGICGCRCASISWRITSSGRPTTTGPGRPELAANMASATISEARSGWSRTITRFAPVPNQACGSNSWKASRSRCSNGIRPTNSTSAVESCHAVCRPTWAFAAPGPRVTMATPGTTFILPSASAMYVAPPSWRHTTFSMPESCRPSRTSR